jgi:NAD(P)H dehydrogenase (quinone)
MILVTGVSGAFGSAAFEQLAADEQVEAIAGSRTPPAGGRVVDFDEPSSLREALAGIDVLLLVSAGYAEDDVVLHRHRAAIEAAAAAGVRHVIYTSLSGSGDRFTIALPHRWTEAALAKAPLDATVLRNGLYVEVPAGLGLAGAPAAAQSGVFRAPWGRGTVPVVARQDLVDVAVKVARETQQAITEDRTSPHAGKVYELDGASTVGGDQLAAALTTALGRPVRYESSPLGDIWDTLAEAGLPSYQIAHTVSLFSNINAELCKPVPSDLPALLDAPPRSVTDLLVDAVVTGGYEGHAGSSRRVGAAQEQL